MSELKAALRPYSLEATRRSDSNSGVRCVTIDVGRDQSGNPVPSLEFLRAEVDRYLFNDCGRGISARKLFIVGEWNLGPPKTDPVSAMPDERTHSEVLREATSTHEWEEGIKIMCRFLGAMGNLEELTWISGLPFMAPLWNALPTTLVKLVVDLGQPIRYEIYGVQREHYIQADDMKPLVQQTHLRELRLFRLPFSMQSIAWETVFRNTSDGGMQILELQMADRPIVRNEHWTKADEVRGLNVAHAALLEIEYKGHNGNGGLHWAFGFGEYLDNFCIRKARISAGLDEATPLPLQCLKLDGFVIDHLPFEHELTDIVLLICGEKCMDAGLRAPRTGTAPHNSWSMSVNNATSHCLIQWPNWTGIFDQKGEQRDKLGQVVPQEMGLSTPYEEYAPGSPILLTEEALSMKDVSEVLDDAARRSSYHFPSTPAAVVEPATPLEAVSNTSNYGSGSVTPFSAAALSLPQLDLRLPGVDGPGTSIRGPSKAHKTSSVEGSGDSESPTTADESSSEDAFALSEQDDHGEMKAVTVSVGSTTTRAANGQGHMARRSLNWLNGPS